MSVPQEILVNGVIIDRAQVEDVDAVVSVLANVFVQTYLDITPELTEEALTYHVESKQFIEGRRAHATSLIEEVTPGMLFVARAKDGLVGYAKTTIDNHGRHWNSGLYVTRQRDGIGTALRRRQLAWHGDNHDIYLTVVPNLPSVKFHEKFGFRNTVKVSEVLLVGGQSLPQQEMKRAAKSK